MPKVTQAALGLAALLAITLTPTTTAASSNEEFASLGRLMDYSAVTIDCTSSDQVLTIQDQGLWNVSVTIVMPQAVCGEGKKRVCAACCPESGCGPPDVCCDVLCICGCVDV